MRAVSDTSPRPAASLIVARHGSLRPEFLLLKRSNTARFMPDTYVFPGGGLDEADFVADPSLSPWLSDVTASVRLGLPNAGLAFYIAAVRETFEECGYLFAEDSTGHFVNSQAHSPEQNHELRRQVSRDSSEFARICANNSWRLSLDKLIYFSHWITPQDFRLRFDTRFFLAVAPTCQEPALLDGEMTSLLWLTAGEALSHSQRRQLPLSEPTIAIFEELNQLESLFDLDASVRRFLPIRAR
jgi:8-oxo-dGTP pyrophosphatase MutT (NUDIX family)